MLQISMFLIYLSRIFCFIVLKLTFMVNIFRHFSQCQKNNVEEDQECWKLHFSIFLQESESKAGKLIKCESKKIHYMSVDEFSED